MLDAMELLMFFRFAHMLDATELLMFFRFAHMLDATELLMFFRAWACKHFLVAGWSVLLRASGKISFGRLMDSLHS